ncbi:MAG: lipid-binding SYLF domain-containing protein [Alphaproteobacteria bacterium]|nr:lipid-binding SYLF domain-containing protein [Alphaproteobacteria bacterium]
MASSGVSRRRLIAALPAAGVLALAGARAAHAASAAVLSRDAESALRRLYAQESRTRKLGEAAVAILVFPKITKAGLLIGGQYGEGALLEDGKATDYYSIAAGSFGLQIGAQTFSYALFFMKRSALDYLRKSDGWSIGSGPSVVVLDKGAAASATSTTLTQDVYAIPFGQSGLMAGIGLEGSKISRITPS